MLKIHHLGRSQSERIVWLCEELSLPYELTIHERDPKTMLSPPALKAMHPLGAAPVSEDQCMTLAESAAIVEYIITRYGDGRLRFGPDHPDYAAYLYWFHFSNGNLQAQMSRLFTVSGLQLPADHPVRRNAQGRLDRVMAHVNARLGVAKYLAGDELTAADIMSVFSLTTMRTFQPVDLGPYPNIRAYLQRIGQRAPYRRAMAKSDPAMPLMLE